MFGPIRAVAIDDEPIDHMQYEAGETARAAIGFEPVIIIVDERDAHLLVSVGPCVLIGLSG